MGYTTEFKGQFDLTPALSADQVKYLQKFAQTRRMKRNPEIAGNMLDTAREAVGLPVGEDGEYFVGGLGNAGQGHDLSIIDYNKPPATQPTLWCQWTPSDSGNFIEWDGNEKFYRYVEWLQYIIDKFLKPWGIISNGTVIWQGESLEDVGTINVNNNIITVDKQ